MNSLRQYISSHQNSILRLASLLVLLLGSGVLIGDLALLWTKNHVRTFNNELDQAVRALKSVDEDPAMAVLQAQQHLNAARNELEILRPFAEPVVTLAGNLTHLPRIGPPAEELINLWVFANETTRFGESLLGAAELGLAGLSAEGVAGLLDTMPTFQKHLRAAEAGFSQAQFARTRLDTVFWLPDDIETRVKSSLARWDTLRPRLEETLATANRLVWIFDTLLDNEQPTTYLLLIQSSDELRATGGFITGVGTVQIERGKVTAVTIGDVQEAEEKREWTEEDWKMGVSGPNIFPPPAPLTRYMGLGHWVLRDANWWADFPTTARQAANFWQIANGTSVDGVIAINAQSVEALLDVVGPIDISDDQLVDAENLEEVALTRVYRGSYESDVLNQTMFFQELAFALTVLPEKLPSKRLLRLGAYLQTAVARHDLLVTSFDPAINAALQAVNLDGSLRGQQDDYLYLVEHNVSYNKLNPFIQQSLKYQVKLGPDGRPTQAMLTVDEVNTYSPGAGLPGYPDGYYDGGRWNPITRQVDHWIGYYGGYTRLFIPAGSRLLEAVGLDDGPEVGVEGNRTVIGGYIGLQANQTRQLQYKWLPDGQPAVPGLYRLVVQRQPGAPDHALTVMVYLPTGYHATEITPSPLSVTENIITWQAVLDQDQVFSLSLAGVGGVASAVTAPSLPTTVPEVAAIVITPQPSPRPTISRPRSVAPAPSPPPGRAPKPVWLNIPAIAVSAPVVPVGLESNGIMASPTEADIIGWFEFGPRPGESSNAVLSGHVNWKGEIGVFARLAELKPGDIVTVQSGPGAGTRYIVESIETYQAATAPVAEIFRGTTEPVLTLITCGGPYDAQQQVYRDRIVVRARGE